MGSEVPKPFLHIRNKPVLWYTMMRFVQNTYVSEIILVVSPDVYDEAEKIVRELNSGITVKITPGGAERQDSVRAGLQLADIKNSVILVHDAVRPFFAPSVIHEGLQLLKKYHGAAAGIPVIHTIKRVEGNRIIETVPRDDLIQIHTPQLFHASVLREAFAKAAADGFYGTDECMLAERYGYMLALIPDTYDNIKLTTPFDLQMAENLVKKHETAYWPGL